MNLNQSNTIVINSNLEDAPKCRDVLAQTKAHSSRTDKYSVVSSGDLIKQLEEAGFICKKVAEERNTLKFKGFGTHLIRCTHPNIKMGVAELETELTPQIYIKNSYHGRTKLEIHLGLFRMFCLNGLVLGDKFKTVKLIHKGLDKEEITALISDLVRIYKEEVSPYVLTLKNTIMTAEQQNEFAKIMLAERLRSNGNFISGDHELLLTVNRPEDSANTAWEVFQRVQENLGLNFGTHPIDGLMYSFNGEDKDGNLVIKERKVSKLSNIKEVTYLNRYAFDTITSYCPTIK